jgi:hypothetical protein
MLCWLLSSAFASFPVLPVRVDASSSLAPELTGPERLVDQSGLRGDRHDAHPQGHTMWLWGPSEGAPHPLGLPAAAWVAFDFGAPVDLLEMTVWNHNQPGLLDRGLHTVRVHTSADGVVWTEHGPFELSQATGDDEQGPTDVIPLPATARVVVLGVDEASGTWGSELGGLAEVAFTASSPPCEPAAGDPVVLKQVEVHPELDRLHRLAPDGWLGADIAHSVVVSPDRTVWLFGDTFVGTSTDGVRDGGWSFFNGSVGIQDPTQPLDQQMTYAWGPDPTGLFAYQGPEQAGRFYWTTQGVMIDGELFVFAMNVTSILEQRGVSVLRVSDPTLPPEQWSPEAVYVDVGDASRMFHSGLWRDGPWLYLLGFDDVAFVRHTVLARVPVAALQAGLTASDYEYYTQGAAGPEWSSDDADLVHLLDEGATESAVFFHEGLGRFVYTMSSVGRPGELLMSTAEALTGPWTEPRCVYVAPEPTWFAGAFTYAVRAHPQLASQPDEIVLSYASNAGSLTPLFEPAGGNLYRPRLVRLTVELPEDTAHTGDTGDTGDTATTAGTGVTGATGLGDATGLAGATADTAAVVGKGPGASEGEGGCGCRSGAGGGWLDGAAGAESPCGKPGDSRGMSDATTPKPTAPPIGSDPHRVSVGVRVASTFLQGRACTVSDGGVLAG